VEESAATGSVRSVLDALTLEYNALRQELSDRLGNRQRTVTVLGASAALLAGLGGRENGAAPGLIIGITVALVVIAVGAWVHNGRMIGGLSAKLAQLEFDINDALQGEFVAKQAMTWHASRQERGFFARLAFGPGTKPTHRRLTE
jgi:hypothetical protein